MSDVLTPRLPAEWESGGSVLVAWPRSGSGWRASLPDARADVAALVRQLLESADVLLLVPDLESREQLGALAAGGREERLQTVLAPYQDVWFRDYGPLAVERGTHLELVRFRFDGWGGKFPAEDDDRVSAWLYERAYFGSLPLRHYEVVLEGGNVDSDGDGTLLVSARPLLDSRRHPTPGTRDEWESFLAQTLGAHRLLWVEHGWLPGDDTDGHIDTLVRFVASDVLVYQEGAGEAFVDELATLRDRRGAPYELVPLPAPPPLRGEDGEPLPANYCNFVLVPGRVLVPAYGFPSDREALARLRRVFPDRDVVPVPSRGLVHQYGSLHCATMTLPEGILSHGEPRA